MPINILETTIRDGSYAIDFQFSVEDTAVIAVGLEKAGFRLIEIGHGVGLNASNAGKGKAAASDREYLEIASKVLSKAKFGMFFIPGIGRKKDLKLAAEYGMSFVRIGTNVTEAEEAAPYVPYAKALGFTVTLNLMKSYALPLSEFIQKAKLVEGYGVDIIYLVDSAGGMFPEDVRQYITLLKEKTDCDIGFHGHDNLNLALANTLEALKCGATYVDSSLQGMGRSAGNTQTEVLLLVLDKLGYHLGIDILKTMDIGERLIKPLMRERHGVDSISVVSGFSQFHSSFLSNIYKVAKMYDIDPRELIIEVSERDKVNVTEKLAMETAKELIQNRKRLQTRAISLEETRFDFKPRGYKPYTELKEQARMIADDIASVSLKRGKESVFVIAVSTEPQNKCTLFPFIQESLLYVVGNAEVSSTEQIEEIIPEFNGKIQTIIVDVEEKGGIRADVFEISKKLAPDSRVLSYKDNDIWVEAIASLVVCLYHVYGQSITVIGANNLSYKLALRLAERGSYVVISPDEPTPNMEQAVERLNEIKLASSPAIRFVENKVDAARGTHMLIGMTPRVPSIDKEVVEVMNSKGLILDGGLGTITAEATESAHKIGIKLLRIDMRSVLMGKVYELLNVDYHVSTIMGRKPFAGVNIVAGGVVGQKGDVVVDSVSDPSRVIGVADGKGGVIYDNKRYQPQVDKVRTHIYHKKLADIFGDAPTNEMGS